MAKLNFALKRHLHDRRSQPAEYTPHSGKRERREVGGGEERETVDP